MTYTDRHMEAIRAVCDAEQVFDQVHTILKTAATLDGSQQNAWDPLVDLLTELLGFRKRCEELHHISLQIHDRLEDQLHAYVMYGCQTLHLDAGFVTHVSGDEADPLIRGLHSSNPKISPRDLLEAGRTYSTAVHQAKTIMDLGIDDASERGEPPLSEGTGLYRSIGTPIWVNHKIVGTLIFLSNPSDLASFKQSNLQFLEIMAHHIGQALHTAQIEQTLNDQEAILQLFVKHTPAAVAMFDTDIRYLLASNRWLTDYGLEGASIIGRSHYEIFPEIGEDWKAIHQRVLKGEVDIVSEADFIRADGKRDWLRWEVRPWYRGNVIGGIIMFTEVITKRKNMELALQQSQSLYRSLIEHLPNTAVMLFDHDLHYTVVEGSILQVMGYPQEQLLGKTVFEALSPEQQQVIVPIFRNVLEGESIRFEYKLNNIDYSTHTVPVYDLDGNIINGLAVTQDISERKQSEQALNAKLQHEHEFQAYLKKLHDITIELMQTDQIDTFYRRAVELGREHLGFERLGFFLYDAKTGTTIGTYGTDTQGQVIDERHIRFVPSPTGVLMRSFERTERFAYAESMPLYTGLEPTGMGWNAAAVLWNGTESLGWLTADNGLSHMPATQPLLDILSLYALTLGTLLASKRTSVALYQSESRYRLLAENITDMVSQITLDGTLLYISPSVRSLLGYAPDELIGTSAYAFLHPDDLLPPMSPSNTGIRPSTPIPIATYRAQHKDGHFVWLESSSKSLFSQDAEEFLGFVTASRDITDRKQVEDALKKSAAEIHDLYNQAPCGYHSVDETGLIVAMNDTELRWLGYTREEVIHKLRFIDLLTPESIPIFQANFTHFKEHGTVHDLQFDLACKDGQILHVLLNATAIYDHTGQFLRSRSTLFDMGEIKKAQDTLLQALKKEQELNELKTRFVSMASHEFRTPLTTILTSSETLSRYRHKMKEEQIEQRLQTIQEQVGYLTDIMDDVLLLARLQARRAEFNPIMLNVDQLCRRILDEFQTHPDMDRHFVYVADTRHPEVELDPRLMRQVIGNLISNAVKYSSNGMTITIELRDAGSDLALIVQDEGIGIPEADLAYLFEPFHRAGNVGTIAGTGLGLTILKEAVERQGGRVQVESQVGCGTTFTITLPRNHNALE